MVHSVNEIICECTIGNDLLKGYSIDYSSKYFHNIGEEIRIIADYAWVKKELEEKYSLKYKISDASKKAIVCTKNWKNDILNLSNEGVYAVPFWLYLVTRKGMINYDKLKKVAKVMKTSMGELLEWIKDFFQVRIVLVYGNCQNMSINSLITSSNQLMNKYLVIDMLPVHEIKGEEKTVGFEKSFIDKIDLLIYQNISVNNRFSENLTSDNVIKLCNEQARCICIPNVYFTGYYPQDCANPYNIFLKEYNNVPFPYGDINIINMQDKYSAKEIADKLSSDDFYSKEFCIKNAEESLQELQSREEICDVKISDYIAENYKKEMLFFTKNHPSNKVLKELVIRVFALCGEDVSDIDEKLAWENNGREIFIYPSVRKGLGLEFDKDKYCWWNVIKKEASDMYTYVLDYLTYCKKNEKEI